jgi:predicted CXXCH cytochrome family protein
MKRTIKYIIIFIFTTSIGLNANKGKNDECFRCHASNTLKLRDSSGIFHDFSVDPEMYANSNHSELACVTCHTEAYKTWQHPDTLKVQLDCISCHGENSVFVKNNPVFEDKFAGIKTGEIYKEFNKSIHKLEFGDDFSCFSCHDPHEFKRDRSVTVNKIQNDNEMCLNCHVSTENKPAFADKEMPSLEKAHSWLPNPDIHWDAARCVDCHSSYEEPNLSHNILPKEQAIRDCESCHSQNTVLLTKLYKYEHQEGVAQNGFLNGVLLSNAYVVGSTRHKLMDTLSVIFFGLTVMGLLGHGFLRYYKGKKAEKKDE